jgi:hypothetical protein
MSFSYFEDLESKALGVCFISTLLLITAPITLPIIGVGYVGYKIHEKIQSIKKNNTYEKIKDNLSIDVDNVWTNDNIIIGFTIKNTHFIIIDYKITTEYNITTQIEKKWNSGQNFIIAYINQDNFKYGDLRKLYIYDYSQDTNKIKIFYLVDDVNKKVGNIENYNVKLNKYSLDNNINNTYFYGIIGNVFKCEYY